MLVKVEMVKRSRPYSPFYHQILTNNILVFTSNFATLVAVIKLYFTSFICKVSRTDLNKAKIKRSWQQRWEQRNEEFLSVCAFWKRKEHDWLWNQYARNSFISINLIRVLLPGGSNHVDSFLVTATYALLASHSSGNGLVTYISGKT